MTSKNEEVSPLDALTRELRVAVDSGDWEQVHSISRRCAELQAELEASAGEPEKSLTIADLREKYSGHPRRGEPWYDWLGMSPQRDVEEVFEGVRLGSKQDLALAARRTIRHLARMTAASIGMVLPKEIERALDAVVGQHIFRGSELSLSKHREHIQAWERSWYEDDVTSLLARGIYYACDDDPFRGLVRACRSFRFVVMTADMDGDHPDVLLEQERRHQAATLRDFILQGA